MNSQYSLMYADLLLRKTELESAILAVRTELEALRPIIQAERQLSESISLYEANEGVKQK